MLRFTLFLRSLLFFVIMTIATVVWALACFLFAPFPYARRYYLTSRWNVFVIWLAKVICGIHYQVKGMQNFPDAPAIVLCKHQSAWETIFLRRTSRFYFGARGCRTAIASETSRLIAVAAMSSSTWSTTGARCSACNRTGEPRRS